MKRASALLVWGLAILQGINFAECTCGFYCQKPNACTTGGFQPPAPDTSPC